MPVTTAVIALEEKTNKQIPVLPCCQFANLAMLLGDIHVGILVSQCSARKQQLGA